MFNTSAKLQSDQDKKTRKATTDCGFREQFRAQLVIEIFRRRKVGESFACIAHALNKQDIPGEQGGRWYGATVRNIFLQTQSREKHQTTFY
jgi:hypothetical protein